MRKWHNNAVAEIASSFLTQESVHKACRHVRNVSNIDAPQFRIVHAYNKGQSPTRYGA